MSDQDRRESSSLKETVNTDSGDATDWEQVEWDAELARIVERTEFERRQKSRGEEDPLGIFSELEMDPDVRQHQEMATKFKGLFKVPWWVHRIITREMKQECNAGKTRSDMTKGYFKKSFVLTRWSKHDPQALPFTSPSLEGRRVTITDLSNILMMHDSIWVRPEGGCMWTQVDLSKARDVQNGVTGHVK
jgi:hypothetical protein